MHHAIAAYADRGNNLIVDYILYKPELLPDLEAALKDEKVYLIGIYAPLDVYKGSIDILHNLPAVKNGSFDKPSVWPNFAYFNPSMSKFDHTEGLSKSLVFPSPGGYARSPSNSKIL